MNRVVRWLAVLVFIGSLGLAPCMAQTSSGSSPKSADSTQSTAEMQRVLHDVGENYRNAATFRIRRTRVQTVNGSTIKSWAKYWGVLAKGSGGRSLSENSGVGSTYVVVSDGKTEWNVIPEYKEYTQSLVTPESKARSPFYSGWMKWLMNIDGNLGTGKPLGMEAVEVDGARIECLKILGPRGATGSRPGATAETVYWIDPVRKVLVKEQFTAHSNVPGDDLVEDTVTTYSTEINSELPDSLFTYVPPKDAKLVERLGATGTVELVGKAAPPINLKTLDGKSLDLSSFKGKPVLVDFWATWCGSCTASMPYMARLYGELKDKGVVLVGVNKDVDANAAIKYLKSRNYEWPNFFDPDNSLDSSWGVNGIPSIALLDKDGIVATVLQGYEPGDEIKLRYELHRIDPAIPLAK